MSFQPKCWFKKLLLQLNKCKTYISLKKTLNTPHYSGENNASWIRLIFQCVSVNQSHSSLLFFFLFISACLSCSSSLFLSISFSSYKSNGATLAILCLQCVKVREWKLVLHWSAWNQHCCDFTVLKCGFRPITTKHSCRQSVFSTLDRDTPTKTVLTPPSILKFCQFPFFQHPSPRRADLEVTASLKLYSLHISHCVC